VVLGEVVTVMDRRPPRAEPSEEANDVKEERTQSTFESSQAISPLGQVVDAARSDSAVR
jgi:hypothetical protein